ALQPGRRQTLMQPLAHPLLVAVALGGVEVAIAEPQRRLDGVDAGLLLQGHGAEPDRRDARAVGLNHIHALSLPLLRACSMTALPKCPPTPNLPRTPATSSRWSVRRRTKS